MEDYKINKEGLAGLVSVIIPTHNRCRLLKETIDSLLSQSYKKIEIIIVDDHSTDETYECTSYYVRHYNFIYYVESDKNGACAARNIGICESHGEYIQFIDDDDLLHEDFLKLRVDALKENKEAGFATCNMFYFHGNLSEIQRYFRMDNFKHDIYNHLLRSAMPAPLFLFRRSTILKIGFWDETCLKLQDICYYHRLFLESIVGIWLPNYLYFVRLHERSISNTYNINILNSVLSVFDKIRKEWKCGHKLTKKLSRILFLVSMSTIGQSKYRLNFLPKVFSLIFHDFNSFCFFVRFVFLRSYYGKRAIDVYL